MGVRVSTRTVWFAVCQECTRQNMTKNAVASTTIIGSQSEDGRTNIQSRHSAETGHIGDWVLWDVTAGVPDLVAGKDKSVS